MGSTSYSKGRGGNAVTMGWCSEEGLKIIAL